MLVLSPTTKTNNKSRGWCHHQPHKQNPMSGPNHIVGGIVFTGIYLSMWDKNIYAAPHLLFFTAFFAVLPDVDHTKSLVGKSFYPIAKWLDKKFGHRTITHSLLCYAAMGLLIGLVESLAGGNGMITKIFIWAYGSHLVFDMLTVQGVPLFYPFKKNPCVIPGNPKFRFKSSDFKTEGIILIFFTCCAIFCKDLFANGFWNTYNQTFDNVKHLNAERLMYDKNIEVDYNIEKDGKKLQGKAILIKATKENAVIFGDIKKGSSPEFITVQATDRINNLKPIRTGKSYSIQEIRFANIGLDSLLRITNNKLIISIKLQATLPINYTKENKPQSSTSIDLDYLYNPIFKSSDIDSIDLSTEKDIELTKQEISNNQQQQAIYSRELGERLANKQKLYIQYQKILQEENSTDLAIKEHAIREVNKAKSDYENYSTTTSQPTNQSTALAIRLQFLQSKLHIKKSQSITGYISYFTIQ